MGIQRTLLPGQPGTKKLAEKFGDDLVCVRYRYDLKKEIRLTTAEIVVDRKKWNINKTRVSPNKIMDIRIEYGERELVQQVKSLGGRWDRQQKVWKLPFRYVQILNLEDRIVKN